MSSPIRLGRAFATVGLWTMLSRVLGFVRDILIAGVLGAGPIAEAFLIAFALPNMFRRFFAEGAFNMAFVPMFSKKLETGDDPKGFARDAFAGLAGVLVVFSAVALMAMPWLVLSMASGFSGDERFGLAVEFGRIAFPYILLISLAALLSGLLNATGRFVAAAAAPVLLNVVFLLVLIAAPRFGWDTGRALAWAVPAGGIAQLALVWWAAARAGFALVPKWPRMTPELKRLALIAAPAALAGGVVQVNLLVGRQVASWFDGAVAWLYYADRLYQLPLGVVGVAIGVVLLPDLSRRLGARDDEGGQAAFSRAAEMSMALTLPAAMALMVIPLPIVSVLFERGSFGAEDSAATALALAVYAMGLPAFVLQKVLQPLYFAREDTKRPFYYALLSLAVNAVVAIGLSPFIGYLAAAVGTTLSAWVMVGQLWLGSRKMGVAAQLDARFRQRIRPIAGATLLMGACLWLGSFLIGDAFYVANMRYAALTGLIGLGIVSYFGLGGMIGAYRLGELKRALKR
ncbi:MAG: murein biosynthesis integral membrane protein MurJ [Brevirhabdus sp.]